MGGVEECAVISGTLSHNMLFAEDGTKLVVIEKQALNNEIQADINVIKNLSVDYVDGNYSIYPVVVGSGPFLMAFNSYLCNYADSRDYEMVNDYYLTEKYLKKCLKKYMRTYKMSYYYQWIMNDWYVAEAGILYEAYCDSMRDIGGYITGNKCWSWYQAFECFHLKSRIKAVARFIRRIIRNKILTCKDERIRK